MQRDSDPRIGKAAVVLENVSKTFSVSEAGSSDAGSARRRKSAKLVQSLGATTLVARPGESIGVVGHNGSGKSTLLRLIAGAETPTTGRVLVSSKPVLLGVAPALQPYLTGRQNVVLGLLALGKRSNEAKEMEPAVSQWADIGDAIDRPLRTYSAGQSARLGFAISTAVDPDILLIDEALSTGDAAFAQKARERMSGLLSGAKNLFLVSHVADQVLETCERALWIHRGELIMDGEAEHTMEVYREWSRASERRIAEEVIDAAKRSFTATNLEWE